SPPVTAHSIRLFFTGPEHSIENSPSEVRSNIKVRHGFKSDFTPPSPDPHRPLVWRRRAGGYSRHASPSRSRQTLCFLRVLPVRAIGTAQEGCGFRVANHHPLGMVVIQRSSDLHGEVRKNATGGG